VSRFFIRNTGFSGENRAKRPSKKRDFGICGQLPDKNGERLPHPSAFFSADPLPRALRRQAKSFLSRLFGSKLNYEFAVCRGRRGYLTIQTDRMPIMHRFEARSPSASLLFDNVSPALPRFAPVKT
jgi:hypothetical protein